MDKTHDRFDHHLPYEIDMLIRTYAYLRSVKPDTDQLFINVFIESFSIHARALMEFFEKDGRKFTTPSYQPPQRDATFKRFWEALNKQIAHLDPDGRFVDPKDKINELMLLELNNWLSDQLDVFRTHLRPEYATPALLHIPKVVQVGPATSTATNAILKTTFGNDS